MQTVQQNRHRYVGNSFWVRNDCHVSADLKFKVEAGVEDTYLAGETRIPIAGAIGSRGVPIIESKITGTAKDGTEDPSAQVSLRFEAVNGRPGNESEQFVVKQLAGKGGIKIAFTPEGVQLTTKGQKGEVKLTLPGTYSSKKYVLPSNPNITEVRCKSDFHYGGYLEFSLLCVDSSKPQYQSKTYSFLWTGEPNWKNANGSPAPNP